MSNNNSTKEISLYLYRNLARQCSKFDKTPKYKQYFVTPKSLRPSLPTFFLPSVSFLHNLKIRFRETCKENELNNDIIKINTSLSNGFYVLKNLNLAKYAFLDSTSEQLNTQMKSFYNKIGEINNEHEIEPLTNKNNNINSNIKNSNNNNNNSNIVENKSSNSSSSSDNNTTTTTPSTTNTTTTTMTAAEALKNLSGNNNNTNTVTPKKLTKKEIKLQKQQLLLKQNENRNRQFWPIIDQEDEDGNVSVIDNIKPGTILIAHPSLGDTFSKKVLLITHIVDGRHYGFFINNPILTGPALAYINMELKPSIDKAVEENNHSKNFTKLFKYAMKRPLSPLQRTNWNFGGPESIADNSIFVNGIDGLPCSQVIHPFSNLSGSKKIRDGLYIGGKLKDIGDKIRNKEIDPSKLLMFVGCSVWRPGQLEKEIKEGAWFKADCTNDLILKQTKTPDFWAEALNSMGGVYSDLVKNHF